MLLDALNLIPCALGARIEAAVMWRTDPKWCPFGVFYFIHLLVTLAHWGIAVIKDATFNVCMWCVSHCRSGD